MCIHLQSLEICYSILAHHGIILKIQIYRLSLNGLVSGTGSHDNIVISSLIDYHILRRSFSNSYNNCYKIMSGTLFVQWTLEIYKSFTLVKNTLC